MQDDRVGSPADGTPDQQHDAVRPVRPTIDQGKAGGICRSFEEIVACKALCVRKSESQLTGLNAACHARAPIPKFASYRGDL